jgi:hypothetical protein
MPSSGGTFALAHQGSSNGWGRPSTATFLSEVVNLNSTTVIVARPPPAPTPSQLSTGKIAVLFLITVTVILVQGKIRI